MEIWLKWLKEYFSWGHWKFFSINQRACYLIGSFIAFLFPFFYLVKYSYLSKIELYYGKVSVTGHLFNRSLISLVNIFLPTSGRSGVHTHWDSYSNIFSLSCWDRSANVCERIHSCQKNAPVCSSRQADRSCFRSDRQEIKYLQNFFSVYNVLTVNDVWLQYVKLFFRTLLIVYIVK